MLISLWMIAKRIQNCGFETDIHSEGGEVETFRIMAAGSMTKENHTLMVWVQKDGVRISAGKDSILLKCGLETAVNELAAIFHYYDSWERRMKNALNEHADLKETLEILNEVCPYPIAFMELDGSVIACSDRFSENEVNDHWYMIKNSRQVPMPNALRSHYNETIYHKYVDETPQYLDNDNGEKYIGMYFSRESRRVMGMIIIEFGELFTPDIYRFCEILHEMIRQSPVFDSRNVRTRTRASILFDLLEGNRVEAADMDRFYENESFIFPWNIAVIREQHFQNRNFIGLLIDALKKNIRVKTVALNYEENLVVLVQQKKRTEFLEELEKILDLHNYQIGFSMAFQSLNQMQLRYQQACFAVESSKESGVRYCEKYALDFMVRSIKQKVCDMEMLHPALKILRKADARKNSQLYETLEVYLNHDRSINASAEAMFVHRNSMIYRMNRIKELTGVDLDNPAECEYLRLSYLVEKA